MKETSSSFGFLLAGVWVAGALAAGCAGSSSPPPSAPAAPVASAVPAAPPATEGAESAQGIAASGDPEEEQGPAVDEQRAFHRHHHVGFIGFALMSIPSLGVAPEEQAAVDKIGHDAQVKFRPMHDAEAALLNVLADGVGAGKIDEARVKAAIAKMADVSTQMDDATNDELNKLHAALTPPERQALALKVQAHYEIWYRANADEAAQPNQELEGGQIHHLAQVLGLSAEQVQKIDAAFTQSIASLYATKDRFDTKAAEEHLTAFASAFPADQFDAKTLTTADKANASIATWGAMRMVRMYSAMTPVLTAAQRTKLAALLRDHATKLEAK